MFNIGDVEMSFLGLIVILIYIYALAYLIYYYRKKYTQAKRTIQKLQQSDSNHENWNNNG